MNPFNASFLMSELIDEAEEAGIRIAFRTDIAALYRLENELTGKALSPLFHPGKFDLVSDRVFWIHGTNEEGRSVHVQASKLDDTGRNNLEELLQSQLARCFHSDPPLTNCTPMRALRGMCAYHGDTWVDRDLRKNGLGPLLTKIGLLATFIRWQPDYVYAWFENPILYGGFGVRSWYTNFARVGQHWHKWILPQEFFSWMSHEDMINLIELETPRSGLKHLPR